MLKILTITALPLAAAAQSAPTSPAITPTPAKWAVGFGAGNGLEMHGGYYGRHLLAYGRLRGKWWGPTAGPTSALFGDDLNTRNHQFEIAALLGYPLAVGRSTLYGAAGLAYLDGRTLGEYRYTLRKSGLASTDGTHYYSYRDYRALGLPLEIGYLSPVSDSRQFRFGIAGQANYNPQQTVYCVLVTVWMGVSDQ